ncbi:MAG: NADH-quinone oxidoreductase subunit E [Turneriella sp.]|nr:NADH-quinone oxidoreductase subunit E [Turneriella sp.]
MENGAKENATYSFSPPFEERFLELEKKFPKRTSLVLWSLHLVQEDIGYVSPAAIDYVAQRVGVAPSWIKGVLSFYSMFREKPIGKYHLNVCSNLMCQLKGSDEIEACIHKKLGIKDGETTPDGKFTYTRQTECLAACGYAPAMLLNNDFYELLTPESISALIDELNAKG